MEQNSLSKWLKVILIGVGLCGLIVYFVIIPVCGSSIVDSAPEMANRFWPWQIFLWMTGIPCFIALYDGWRIASNIGNDHSFSRDNASYLKWISWLAAGDAAFFFVGNIVLGLLNMSHPGVALVSLLVVFAGIAIAVAAAALSHLVLKAAILQEENDLTI